MRRRTVFYTVNVLLAVVYCNSSPVPVGTVCTQWIDRFWSTITMGSEGNATVNDFYRLFTYMDRDGSNEVVFNEFKPVWFALTSMINRDSRRIFHNIATNNGGSNKSIDQKNVKTMFNFLSDNKTELSKQKFRKKFENDILPNLPNKGCPRRTQAKDTPDDDDYDNMVDTDY